VIKRGGIEKGLYNFTWNGKDKSGNAVNSGIYFIRMTLNDSGIPRTYNSRVVKH